MANYHLSAGLLQGFRIEGSLQFANWLRGPARRVRAYLSYRCTAAALAKLDRRTLEDIGVPHDDASPAAGPLCRFPIRIRSRGRAI